MLARGQADDGVIRRHDEKTVSAQLKGLGDVAPLESKESLQIKEINYVEAELSVFFYQL